ncbi:MAG: glucarate dehydratase [Bacteroidetes bacterium]|nr:MAG: glucarate dehydratase [Bacteroidota bacterium]
MKHASHLLSAFRLTPIAVGDPPLLNAAGVHAPYALRIIVELQIRQGGWGISEIPGSERILQSLHKALPRIMGMDVFQLHSIRQVLQAHAKQLADDQRGLNPWDARTLVHIFSAVEVACLDLQGKLLDRPLVDLLGGKMRERVPFAAYLFYKYEGEGAASPLPDRAAAWREARRAAALDPAGIVGQAQAMCGAFGFNSIKLKGGAFPPKEEVAAVLALRQAFGPEVPLRFDPNAVWKFDTALKWGKQMEGVLEYLEDPVRGQQQMAALRKKIDIPLATNMCTTAFDELPESIRLQSEDIILSDHHFWGGLRACMQLHRICHTFGRGFSMHSNSHLGISLAAMVHLGAAIPRLDYALDTHYPWQADEVIAGGKLPIEEGCVALPEGPGLGVEIDPRALQRLHQNYLKCGLKERNDEVEMQKYQPGWTFQPSRW